MGRDDEDIVNQVLGGDRDAFGVLIDRHRGAASRLALRILRGRADAEDVTQDAFLHAYLDLRELRARDRFLAWLLGIVVNLARSGRLRRLLAAEFEAMATSAGRRGEEGGMIEVMVDDVIVRAPKDEPVRYSSPTREGNLGRWRVILLREREGGRVLPIWVGQPEGDMIALRLGGIETPRPMSLMLMARVLELAEIAIERVVVTTLRDNIFYAVLGVRIGDRRHEVDARPSDAINLALYRQAPIFVAPEMLALPIVINAGTALPQLEEEFHRKQAEKNAEPEVPAMEWRSFRTLPDPRTARA
jgi:bifunctional DNase/RNase